ncbi:RNA pseudouridylate synthase domain-containing protein 2 [Tachysurus fulvidraco]|uniref:RNA pseudouridylate synthase domain-containing protein 2 n=1 Tax=Tachysurus fulvidraco TaxID=1234273 RepID=UPI000F4F4430|nr:RNA pseudouridylate synthase domain-containing protein 2 [Tachysurus fulvidraco]
MGMSARHVSANGLPVTKCVYRLICSLLHGNRFKRIRVPGDVSASLDKIVVNRNITKYKHLKGYLHATFSAFSIMETKELNDAGIEKEQGVHESCKKRKNDDPEEEHEKNKRGKKRKGGKQRKPGDRYVPPPQKRNPGVSFNQEHFAETSYYFEEGLRKVHPYYFDFKTYCKGRWIGKTLLEVFSSEFRAEPLNYYKKAVKEGRIRLNEIPVDDLNITLKNNDFMRNTVHRHEPPVNGQPLQVLVDDGEVVVVDKPASLPVHPCGRYRHNTVIFILGKERGLSGLHTVHRLDRLTSGILLFARTLEMSQKLDQMVRDRQLEKEYVCRVEGEFPDGEVVCEEPIMVVSFKVGLCRVDPKGKDSRTVFQKLSYNGCSSVVRCLPLTGRTHQIRVHLQYLGFPILNDPIYGSSAWGPNRGKGGLVGKNDQELLEALIEEHRSKESLHLLDITDEVVSGKSELDAGTSSGALVNNALTVKDESGNAAKEDCEESTSNDKEAEMNITQAAEKNYELSRTADATKVVRDHLCSECKIVRPDPTAKELVMYLHALRYKGPDFEYSTQLPDWAKEDWVQN